MRGVIGRVTLWAAACAALLGCVNERAAPSRTATNVALIRDTAGPKDAPVELPSEEAPSGDAPSEQAPDEEIAAAEGRQEASVPEPRNVLYRVTDQGLVIEVEGVHFRPQAKSVKNGKGGYEIELTVTAEGVDDNTHTLLSPENGPLAMVATVYKKNGAEQARYVDERSGQDQEYVMPGGTLTLSRKWPSGSVHGPLWWGQKVKLEVGLWGLGTGEDPGRPLKKLFVVEMIGGAKTRAVISPPDV